MNILDIISRPPPQPWAEGDKIPWHDPAFSQRMLQVHLSQDNDWASRRGSVIAKQVDWIHTGLLQGQPTTVLDLGCGPGLYTSRLAALGHTCTGIDFSPASINYAREHGNGGCQYIQGDLRQAEYGEGYGLAMLIFGEFNVFTRTCAQMILSKTYAALKPGGLLVLEAHTFDCVKRIGLQGRSWYSSPGGLWSDQPHLCLNENSWDEPTQQTTERYYIVDADNCEVQRYASTMQAYRRDGYKALLTEAGFRQVTFHQSLTGEEYERMDDLLVIVAVK